MTDLNQYSFVKTAFSRYSEEFLVRRLKESEITSSIRSAVNTCKALNGITTKDISKISAQDKLNVEQCLHDNYLRKNPDFFGKRQTIFID